MKLKRREFLKSVGAGAVAWGVLPGLRATPAFGQAIDKVKVIHILFDGGPDGTDYLVYDLAEAASRRPTIQRAANTLVGIGHDYVKLNGNFSTLYTNWASKWAMFSCVNDPASSGSHEQARANDAHAAPTGASVSTGWLGRIAEEVNKIDPSSFIGWNFSSGEFEQFKSSSYKAIVAPLTLSTYTFANFDYPSPLNDTNETRHRAYLAKQMLGSVTPATQPQSEMQASLQSMHDSIITVRDANTQYGTRTVTYPTTNMGNALKSIATLVAAGQGRVFCCRAQGGHDTHSGEIASNDTNQLAFAAAMDAFLTDMNNIGQLNNVVVIARGEFGRQIAENSTGGTDHGWGGHLFAFGGRVVGGLYGGVATPAQIAVNYGLPRLVDPNEIKRRVVEVMGLDQSVILPYQSFVDLKLPWIV